MKWMLVLYLIQITIAFISTFVNVPTAVSKDFPKWVTYVCPLFRLGDFAIGCLAGHLFLKRVSDHDNETIFVLFKQTICEILVLAGGLIIPCERLLSGGYGWVAHSIIYLPFSVALIWLVASGQGYLSKILSNKMFVKIGGLTSFAFLIHFQVVMDWLMFSNVNKLMTVMVCLLLTLILSYLWKRLVERIRSN